ncbi:PREDICTED: uncharacterized protein LOC106315336 [Brassica oleracea var. oleracea]|uniref:uncharacterized protein LOC106315336 n=1 Tax=Brassica oleracea var. oleracea TaxID=109376 RepID=UPI0006A719B6|nr:PREDICTED: uncharacterized protein LOC106315336 [Brassica oleracea var. oleracea]
MALKLDIAKAFDRVEWKFIDAVMERMGFCQQWRRWIMLCITTVTYSVLINGEPTKIIKPSRGLRQGDPISPYLYIICTEGLSRLIKQNIHNQKIHGFKASKSGPAISHLLFADDSLLFCKATEEEGRNLSAILAMYQKASGQEVNYAKSAISFGKGIPFTVQSNISTIFGITKIGGFGRYLGLPEQIGRKRKEDFHYIVDRIKNKLDSWYSKFLSTAGKEVLLKAVVTALPTYTMSCFLLPKTLIQEITKAMRKFWWSASPDKYSISWIAWNKITASKKDDGLGIRDMMAFNKALLGKQAWKLVTRPSSLLARVYKAKYYRKTGFMEARAYQSSSLALRSIIQTQPLLRKGMHWAVGNGDQIRVWRDNWLLGDPQPTPTGPGRFFYPNLKVKDLFFPGAFSWNQPLLNQLFQPEDALRILRLRPSITGTQDLLYWKLSKTGSYTVRSGYYVQRALDNENAQQTHVISSPSVQLRNQLIQKIWTLKLPPKLKIFWWKVLHNGLPVALNLHRRGCRVIPECQLCGEGMETIPHFLYECRVSREIWQLAYPDLSRSLEPHTNLLMFVHKIVNEDTRDLPSNLAWFIGWRIWKMRNRLLFDNNREHIVQVIKGSFMDLNLWKEAIYYNEPDFPTQVKDHRPHSIIDVLPQESMLYCIADASWKSEHEAAGIGWSLYSRQGTFIMQGSSAIASTNSAFEAEAVATLLAVQQLHKLHYKNVIFLGDNDRLVKSLEPTRGRENTSCHEASTMVQDILNLAKLNDYSFKQVPRNLIYHVDQLAKRARLSNQKYVITWLSP